ncbi:oligopeptide/dipeptide ABC transporter ATP-binding protein [Peribacillus deserti]|uniref:Oligopeptide/dipeptide ABC transporter ATP-binding protein n=1 Tax=Peribacillus deserti TaxID=673318 RepID=A0ABS2QJK2_9BACI|nr:ABC transporter ATP-binding protein [Peribacillus deserti]MBM7693130.1 oligopeptide/dipeptide ABC transporter ATP-binding protein [Peribacillus deserti]
MAQSILDIENLVTKFKTANGEVSAVRGISFSLKKGETLCIVGESGCGKSITALSIMGLLAGNARSEGSINFNGKNLLNVKHEEMRKIRGNEISMIFQEPMTALNPTFTVGFQLCEPLMIHNKLSKKAAFQKGIELLKQVGIPLPEKRMKQYPHELSGGMRQRVMIAIALACNPSLLIADEPTTALDVTIQAQILDLLNDLKDEFQTSLIMITHDMGVVAEVADRVIVMYAGEIIEEGTAEAIFNTPQHPYTKGLLSSVPNVDDPYFKLNPIPGTLPNLNEQISGCRFHPRCPHAMEKCIQHSPYRTKRTENHAVRCWLQEVEESEYRNYQPTSAV